MIFESVRRPSYGRGRRVEGTRLAYYGHRADTGFWDAYWDDSTTMRYYARAEKGYLGPFEEPFTRYLPRRGRVLEAGCGPGHLVLALRRRGYECEGVDWADSTVAKVHAVYPDLPVRVGDVLRLDVSDGHYDAYVSIGVIEHRYDGPEPFLWEARRVLADPGIMLVAVPYFNALRRAKARLGLYKPPGPDEVFFQYAHTAEEMVATLRACGFRVLDAFTYEGCRCLEGEFLALRWLHTRPHIGPRLRRLVSKCKWLDRHWGHMILFACAKSAPAPEKET